MADENKRDPNEKLNNVSEPSVEYPFQIPESNKTVRFFSSFEEMEDDNYKWLANLTPEQHLENATALIKRIFAEQLKTNPLIGNKIYFEK